VLRSTFSIKQREGTCEETEGAIANPLLDRLQQGRHLHGTLHNRFRPMGKNGRSLRQKGGRVKRRDALKAIVIGGATATAAEAQGILRVVRMPGHMAGASEASSSTSGTAAFSTPKYFSQHEFAVVSRLADLIIPHDTSPGALDARAPEYIDLQVSQMPEAQTRISGGVQWLDRYCSEQFSKDFLDCSPAQQTQVLDKLADAKTVPRELEPARSFFVLVRSLTCDGFYSSKLGFQEVGYKGNTFVMKWRDCTHPEHGA